MADPTAAKPLDDGSDQSVGDLVALVLRDVTRLVRCEVDLAKLELRADVRRLGVAGALLGIAGFAACLVLVLLCFAFAYGLMAAGIWGWAAFMIVAGACVVLAGLAIGLVAGKMRGISGLRRTRTTIQEDLALLRREDGAPAIAKAE